MANEKKTFNTAGELKAILADVPDHYALTPYGDSACTVYVADKEKRVYIDTESFIDTYILGEEGAE